MGYCILLPLFNIRLVRCSQPSAAASGIAHVGITRRSPHPSSLTLLKRRVEQRSREARRDRQDGIVWLPGERIPTGQWRSSEVRHARESYRNVSKGDILRRRSQPSSAADFLCCFGVLGTVLSWKSKTK